MYKKIFVSTIFLLFSISVAVHANEEFEETVPPETDVPTIPSEEAPPEYFEVVPEEGSGDHGGDGVNDGDEEQSSDLVGEEEGDESIGGNGGDSANDVIQPPIIEEETSSLSDQFIVDGELQKVETVELEEGKTKRTIHVDGERLIELVAQETNVDKLTFHAKEQAGELVEVLLPIKIAEALREKSIEAKFEVVTETAVYRLPVKEVDIKLLSEKLGGEAEKEATISITIEEVESSELKANANLASKVIEFKVVASIGDKSVELNRFTSFIEREIIIEKKIDPNKTTAVQVMEDGTFRPVPTIFEGNRAIFKSLTNSMYTVIENEVSFSDIDHVEGWAKAEIEKLASKSIIQGFDDGIFKPDAATTRGHLVALLTRGLGLTTDSEYNNQFNDVNGTEWFVPELTAALEAGVIEGYTDGTFKPYDEISREQAAAMIARALNHIGFNKANLATKDVSYYVDSTTINTRFKDDVELLLQAGVMSGGTDQKFRAENIINRAQTAKTLDNFLKFIKFIN